MLFKPYYYRYVPVTMQGTSLMSLPLKRIFKKSRYIYITLIYYLKTEQR